MRMYLFVFTIFVSALGLMSCGSDDENPSINGDSSYSDIISDVEGNVSFCLLNEKMEETNVFTEGSNIIFVLKIDNNSDVDFVVKRDFNGGDLVLDSSFFGVYRDNGEYVGVPWSGMFCEYSLQQEWTYSPYSTIQITCPWYMDTSKFYGMHPLCKGADSGKDWPRLSKGSYYTKFTISYNIGQSNTAMKKQEFVIHFKII